MLILLCWNLRFFLLISVYIDLNANLKVVQSIVASKLETPDANCSFAPEEFAGLNNLKFLQLEGGTFKGNFQNILQQLKWLSWINCPSKIETINLSFKNLVVFKLSSFQIIEDWDGWSSFMVLIVFCILYLLLFH